MVDRDEILELLPHYAALVVIVLVAMATFRTVVGSQNPLIEFSLVVILVFGYRPLVARVDAIPTPTIWERFEGR
ncbi:hypothetical protein SAMN05216226_10352 [Halovenus aranensis]|jgi:hypothetical protein|uniref:Uncharacterized protein n=1 Tax=Halovenus aranensis TaxID=890420 RepID=A0A1G8TIN9_9EURY|nr:hypothetical protein [Halovenus aranensis]SDJ40530.1 hypothetical protein SAMN05216226_10352 [Halovenus aranensis]